MADAECGEVRNDRFGVGKREIAIELQAISRARDVRRPVHDFRNHATDHGGSVPRCSVSAFTPSLA